MRWVRVVFVEMREYHQTWRESKHLVLGNDHRTKPEGSWDEMAKSFDNTNAEDETERIPHQYGWCQGFEESVFVHRSIACGLGVVQWELLVLVSVIDRVTMILFFVSSLGILVESEDGVVHKTWFPLWFLTVIEGDSWVTWVVKVIESYHWLVSIPH